MPNYTLAEINAQRARCAVEYRWFIDSKDPQSVLWAAKNLRLELQTLERMLKANAVPMAKRAK